MTARDRAPFVVLEGVEGAGKSTQLRLLARWLEASGVPHVLAREPGGTAVGEAIREIVQDRPELDVPAETELLLYVAARAAFVRQLVGPALSEGKLVVADRYELSTFAYQGYGRGLDLEEVKRVNALGTGGLEPDLVIFLDLPVAEGRARQERRGEGPDRIEREGVDFMERVRGGYLELLADGPRAEILDASDPPEALHDRVKQLFRAHFPGTFPSGGE